LTYLEDIQRMELFAAVPFRAAWGEAAVVLDGMNGAVLEWVFDGVTFLVWEEEVSLPVAGVLVALDRANIFSPHQGGKKRIGA
jgi:hypothetical protein